MADEAQAPKWEGMNTAELKSLRAEQVWPLVEDFCNLHKILPLLDTCYQLEGVPKQPGLMRHCAFSRSSFSSSFDNEPIKWGNEKLVSINPIERSLSYEILDNNLGFKSYVATIKVLSINGDENQGCQIEWSFKLDPIQGSRCEDLVLYIGKFLQSMAKKIEETIPNN